MYAAWGGDEGIVKMLKDTGKVEVDVRDNDNATPLSYATWAHKDGVIKMLLDTGKVNINVKDDRWIPILDAFHRWG